MCQIIVALSESIFVIVFVNYRSDEKLQIVDMLTLHFIVEGQTGEVRELWEISHSLHLNILLLYRFLIDLT